MRLLKTYSHTSTGLAMEPKHAKKHSLKKSRPYKKANATHQKRAACRRCGGGGGRKGSRTCREPAAYRRCGGRVAGKVLRQTNHRKGTSNIARRALVDREGNTGANTKKKSCHKSPAGHQHGGGLNEETTNTRDERWQHLQPRDGGDCFSRK